MPPAWPVLVQIPQSLCLEVSCPMQFSVHQKGAEPLAL